MKRKIICLILLALTVSVCSACTAFRDPAAAEPAETEGEQTEQLLSHYVNEVYASQLQRYSTALTEGWEEGKYYENEMSALASYYSEGNPLENVGFAFADMDQDGTWELLIGGILNAQEDPAVFEIWTVSDGNPVMLVQSGYRNRYFVEHSLEDGVWLIANEGSNSAANSAWHYYRLEDGRLQVSEAVVFDALANETAPWFLASDGDWDTANDTPVDEQTALALIDGHRNAYTAVEYIPFGDLAAIGAGTGNSLG